MISVPMEKGKSMDDLIRRQDAIEAMNCLNDSICEGQATEALCDLPSAQQWIPCSERLPDQNGKYLVVGRQKAINILKFDGGRWYGKWGVVAWMPLPSPYREETES